MEIFAVLLAVAVVVWLFASPFVVMGLSNRLHEVESRLEKLTQRTNRLLDAAQQETAHTSPAVSTPPIPVPHQAAQSRDEIPLTELLARRPLRTDPPANPKAHEFQPAATAGAAAPEKVLPKQDAIEDKPVPWQELVVAQRHASPSAAKSEDEPSSLEELLAGKWLTWVGALAVIIGAGFGFKYAVDNNWLGPAQRVALGMFVGVVGFAVGAYAMRQKYRFLGQGLTGAAMGILYLSFYASHEWYGLLPYQVAFAGMVVTTVGGLAFAARYDAQPTAFLGLLGGFLTPAMLRLPTDPFWMLFPYLLLLDAGVLWVSGRRRWLGLQNLAFVGTGVSWLVWFGSYYNIGLLWPTIAFLSAFFALFAAMGVIYNIVRQQPALPGDFFLILAAPTAYFSALYGLTYEVYPYWQGTFALAMTVIYGYLTVLCSQLNPKGKSVTAAMAGLAGTFLILAAPLQFTGHWVTIAWIAESVLLVEIGLRFRERTLTWTGLTLLAKVQFILLIYALGTFADPAGFQTAFVRKQLHLIEIPAASELSWTSIFNGRSFSYLVDVLGLGWLAWQCRRRAKAGQADDSFGPNSRDLELWLGAGVPLMGLLLAIVETFVWGRLRDWDGVTIVSALSMWASACAVGVVLWSVTVGPRRLANVAWAIFVLVGGFLIVDLAWTVTGIASPNGIHPVWVDQWWLLNPRGVAFLFALGAMALTALLVRTGEGNELGDAAKSTVLPLDRLFGCGAYLLGLMLVLLETYAWGKLHGWDRTTIPSALAMWTALFATGLVVWVARSRTRAVDGLVGAVFVVLGGFLFFAGVTPFDRGLTRQVAALDAADLELWLLNPRGLAFLSGIAAASLAARLYRGLETPDEQKPYRWGDASAGRLTASQMLGVSAYLAGLAMFTIEFYSQGTARGWLTGTSLAITLVWTVYATATLIAGIYCRSGSVRVLSLALFLLTVAKVFLFDVWHLQTVIRVFAFLSLGVALLLVSFLYRRYRERIREWIAPEVSA